MLCDGLIRVEALGNQKLYGQQVLLSDGSVEIRTLSCLFWRFA
jgi:hypothetical protein